MRAGIAIGSFVLALGSLAGCAGSSARTMESRPIRVVHEGRVYELRAIDREGFEILTNGVTEGWVVVAGDGEAVSLGTEPNQEARLTPEEIAAAHESRH